jgi:hypothetical protein
MGFHQLKIKALKAIFFYLIEGINGPEDERQSTLLIWWQNIFKFSCRSKQAP